MGVEHHHFTNRACLSNFPTREGRWWSQLLENNARGAITRSVFRKGPARCPYLGMDHSTDGERGALSSSSPGRRAPSGSARSTTESSFYQHHSEQDKPRDKAFSLQKPQHLPGEPASELVFIQARPPAGNAESLARRSISH